MIGMVAFIAMAFSQLFVFLMIIDDRRFCFGWGGIFSWLAGVTTLCIYCYNLLFLGHGTYRRFG